MGLAFAHGCIIFFWTMAIGGKMRITDLYYYWEGATGVWGALKALAKGRAVRISLGKSDWPISIQLLSTNYCIHSLNHI